MLKNETQYQMYLDVVDILQKHSFDVKSEKDGVSTKISAVYKGKLCGKIMVAATPPKNRESQMYAMSAHAKLAAAKEDAQKLDGFREGEWKGIEDCLFYYGHLPENSWVEIVDKNFQKWREKSPLYLSNIEEVEKLKKKKPVGVEEFATLERELNRLADSFETIEFYRNAEKLADECSSFVPNMKDEILQKATLKLEKLGRKKGMGSKHFREMAEEYAEVSQTIAMIIPFEGAEEKLRECEELVAHSEREKTAAIYAESVEALISLEKNSRGHSHASVELKKIIADYEDLLARFMSVEQYKDASEKAVHIRGEIAKFQVHRTAALYKEATRDLDALETRPESDKFFEQFYRARHYGKLAKRFEATASYDDSDGLAAKCKKAGREFRNKVAIKIAPFAIVAAALAAIGAWIWASFF
ncbi:MAG: hypothetical protein FWF77_05235 [Defluviitaleaceae bacterium]|nr:hypothetical protein [Defluviitaleaceae bacterium]